MPLTRRAQLKKIAAAAVALPSTTLLAAPLAATAATPLAARWTFKAYDGATPEKDHGNGVPSEKARLLLNGLGGDGIVPLNAQPGMKIVAVDQKNDPGYIIVFYDEAAGQLPPWRQPRSWDVAKFKNHDVGKLLNEVLQTLNALSQRDPASAVYAKVCGSDAEELEMMFWVYAPIF
ncbi:MAG: hypothetical protein U0936_20160 [Planctomycetaceae bacterium]